jgi:hypothetical protein
MKKFTLELVAKETRSPGSYDWQKKKVQINNLSQTPSQINTTALHNVAHHIDWVLHGKSKHDDDFYEIFHALLIQAMNMGVIRKEDLSNDLESVDSKKLRKTYDSFQRWEVNQVAYMNDWYLVKVDDAYSVKEELKNEGYSFNKYEEVWMFTLKKNDISEELQFLQALNLKNDQIEVVDCKFPVTSCVYYLSIQGGFDQREFLKAHGYTFEGIGNQKKTWFKKIKARDLEKEEQLIAPIMGISLKVYHKK